MNVNNLNETLMALRSGVCNMYYTKMDGENRFATGTLNPDFIPKEKLPKNKTVIESVTDTNVKDSNLVHYFDFASNGWRCFWLENLKSLSLEVPV